MGSSIQMPWSSPRPCPGWRTRTRPTRDRLQSGKSESVTTTTKVTACREEGGNRLTDIGAPGCNNEVVTARGYIVHKLSLRVFIKLVEAWEDPMQEVRKRKIHGRKAGRRKRSVADNVRRKPVDPIDATLWVSAVHVRKVRTHRIRLQLRK